MQRNLEIVALQLKCLGDMLKLIHEIKARNIVVISISALKTDRGLLRDVMRRLKIIAKKYNANMLGIGGEYLILAPPQVKIRFQTTTNQISKGRDSIKMGKSIKEENKLANNSREESSS